MYTRPQKDVTVDERFRRVLPPTAQTRIQVCHARCPRGAMHAPLRTRHRHPAPRTPPERGQDRGKRPAAPSAVQGRAVPPAFAEGRAAPGPPPRQFHRSQPGQPACRLPSSIRLAVAGITARTVTVVLTVEVTVGGGRAQAKVQAQDFPPCREWPSLESPREGTREAVAYGDVLSLPTLSIFSAPPVPGRFTSGRGRGGKRGYSSDRGRGGAGVGRGGS